MKTAESFKMPFETNHFNKGQRVWVVFNTGDEAAYCYGKYRGKHRYVRAWVKWGAHDRDYPVFQKFEIFDAFADRISKGG
ncbi:hypothetical protein LCGC14_1642970 [marine sediment metagenome]|uniref:Uncharacterized protein n=1 Tax=marine sediment metagenome TaxID=412755 RepID=A0A0F9HZ01_9ZZZZ